MVQTQINNAKKLIQTIDKKLLTLEYRTTTLKGVRNLSHADLEQIQLYSEHFIRNGGHFYGLMEPRGNVRQVLEKYQVIPAA